VEIDNQLRDHVGCERLRYAPKPSGSVGKRVGAACTEKDVCVAYQQQLWLLLLLLLLLQKRRRHDRAAARRHVARKFEQGLQAADESC
jgi:hypothetical protein